MNRFSPTQNRVLCRRCLVRR